MAHLKYQTSDFQESQQWRHLASLHLVPFVTHDGVLQKSPLPLLMSQKNVTYTVLPWYYGSF